MNDRELEQLYQQAKGVSHAQALRAIYEAGRKAAVTPKVSTPEAPAQAKPAARQQTARNTSAAKTSAPGGTPAIDE